MIKQSKIRLLPLGLAVAAISCVIASAPGRAQDATMPPSATPGAAATPAATPDTSTMTAPPGTMTPGGPGAMTPMAMPMATPMAAQMSKDVSGKPNALTAGPVGEQLNYAPLLYANFDDIDLKRVKSDHYSDEQTARIYKISRLTGLPFREVISRVEEGNTFRALAQMYSIPLGAIRNVSADEAFINSYQSARAATADSSFKRESVLGPNYPPPGNSGHMLMQPKPGSNM